VSYSWRFIVQPALYSVRQIVVTLMLSCAEAVNMDVNIREQGPT